MSTDIVDKDLKALRNARWDKAFNSLENSSGNFEVENPRDEVNRKATIVIEHIIQASDISHTMQHWNVYRKWNQNLFEELYVAYLNGRMDKDPSDFWYKGEFGFFDFCKYRRSCRRLDAIMCSMSNPFHSLSLSILPIPRLRQR